MRRQATTRDPLYRSREYLDLLGRLAANVRRLRQERGWTQEEAAARCAELSVFVLRQVEAGSTNVTAVTLARLAAGFGADFTEFVQAAAAPTRRGAGRPAVAPHVAVPVPAAPPPATPTLAAHPLNEGEELARVDNSSVRQPKAAALGEFTERSDDARSGQALPALAVPSPKPRIVATEFVLPAYPSARGRTFTMPELRNFLATVLAANPQGLTASELVHAARTAGQEALPRSNVNYALHYLVRRGHVERAGSKGNYVHWWKGETSGEAARRG